MTTTVMSFDMIIFYYNDVYFEVMSYVASTLWLCLLRRNLPCYNVTVILSRTNSAPYCDMFYDINCFDNMCYKIVFIANMQLFSCYFIVLNEAIVILIITSG